MAVSHLAGKSPAMLSMMLLFGILLASLDTAGAQIGVCYGMLGNLPPPPEVIALYNERGIQRMRLYDPNQDALRALGGTSIELILGILNPDLQGVRLVAINVQQPFGIAPNICIHTRCQRLAATIVEEELELAATFVEEKPP